MVLTNTGSFCFLLFVAHFDCFAPIADIEVIVHSPLVFQSLVEQVACPKKAKSLSPKAQKI